MPHVFEYALLRAVPRQDRGEAMNIGVLVHCKALDYLGCRTHVDEARLRALDPGIDTAVLAEVLAGLTSTCAGEAGPVTSIPPSQRFRWLTAPRSTLVQTSPTHTGLTDDPEAELERMFASLVLLQDPAAT
ncbi:DUF3037 domain-containing protein [Actinokineospora bangkokensis]|uniref:DUF3037 domain-containing protein n=1 Tax=Actinokineospora bangkokensis TaxID=1193682 RepID=A0A1Q9LKI7_9PSEU|nr:DUF3037 domain-containing protein [Actinokineospora bangkokensis]OLR92538.1 hypothetical protein BJP25_20975 [Actinokineospora bangkokensis]